MMRTLYDCRIVVVEDEHTIADELGTELSGAGAVVPEPVGTFSGALALAHSDEQIDGAILRLTIRGDMTFSFAGRPPRPSGRV